MSAKKSRDDRPGKAERWLRECLRRSKVFELDQRGVSATL